jgi:hypothetical protein
MGGPKGDWVITSAFTNVLLKCVLLSFELGSPPSQLVLVFTTVALLLVPVVLLLPAFVELRGPMCTS